MHAMTEWDGRRRPNSPSERRRSRMLAAVVLALTAALAAACGSSDSGDGSSSEIRIALSTPLLWPEVSVATDAKLWAKHDLEPVITEFPTGNEANQSLLGGSADVATVAPTPVLLSAAQGNDVRVVGLAGYWETWRLQALRASGISTPADLAGKSIGVTLGSSSEMALQVFLEENGLSADDVKLVNVRPPDMIPSISKSSVDAINIWQPMTYRAEQTVPDSKRIDFPYTFRNNYLFVTTQSVLEKDRDLVVRFMAVMKEAADLMASDPETAASAVAKASGLTAEEAEAVLKEYRASGGPADDGVIAEFEFVEKFTRENDTLPAGFTFDPDELLVADVAGE